MQTNIYAQPIVVVPVVSTAKTLDAVEEAAIYHEFCGNIAFHMPIISLISANSTAAKNQLTQIRHKINTLCSLVSDFSNLVTDDAFQLEAKKQYATKIRQCVDDLYGEVLDGYDVCGRRTIADCEFQIAMFFDRSICFQRFQGEATRFTLAIVSKQTVEQLQSFQLLYDVIIGNVKR